MKTNLYPEAQQHVDGYMKDIEVVIKIYSYELLRCPKDQRETVMQKMYERVRELIERRDHFIELFTVKENV